MIVVRAAAAALALASATLVTGCGSGGAATGQAPDAARGAGTLADVAEIYRALEPSVVAVLVRGERGSGEGSGVVVRRDKIVTNNHVVAGATQVTVALASGDRLPARVVARDARTDLAVLDLDRDDLPPASLAGHLPPIGSPAVAIGNPLGFESSVTAGVVSGVDRSIPSGGTTPALVGLVQTDAAISPGNSGGALVGADRRVIGVNVAYIPPQARAVSIGFAIPAPTVRMVVDELLADGKVEHPYLGVRLRPLGAEAAERLGVAGPGGAAVAVVEEGSPAARAGIRPGDVIVRVGDRRIETVEDVIAELREEGAPGRPLPVVLLHDGQRRPVSVTPTKRPASPG